MPTVLIAGGTGLLGQRLSQLLRERKYEVSHLSRRPQPEATFPTFQWDVGKGILRQEAIEKADYIINLAGAGIADKPWSTARKKIIIDSRVKSTLLLKAAIEKRQEPPKAYIAASAIGYYGNRQDETMDENALPGSMGFLPESVRIWEDSISQISSLGLRTVIIRIGIVLSTRGGALEKMMLPFRFFLALYFGNGQQWYSWIHIEDLCRMFIEAIEDTKMEGIYNGVAPNPVRNKELVSTIKEVRGKPALLFPSPSFLLRAAMGEMAEMILDGTKVSCSKMEDKGFTFKFPELSQALKDLLKRYI